MEIISGLFDHMVWQRDGRQRSDALVCGRGRAAGELSVRVTKGGRPVAGFAGRKLGRIKNRFRVRLAGVPSGGPYRIELRVAQDGRVVDRLAVNDVLVGDVWLVAGQSNMQGCGRLAGADKPHPLVRAFYMDDRWAVAQDPIHNLWACVDQVHIDFSGGVHQPQNTVTGTGPAVSFGQEMWRRTGVPQGLIACAHGGTSMAQWDPAQKNRGTKSLYGATIRRFVKNGSRVAGLIWYQGESDANPPAVTVYTRAMKKFIRALRRDTGSPRLPVALVQIARVVGYFTDSCHWNSIQEQQRLLPQLIPQVATVPAVDLALDDGIHVSGVANHRLGARLAEAMRALTAGKKGGLPPLALRSVKLAADPRTQQGTILVEFDHVAGKLVAGSRPTGFTLVKSAPQPYIFDTVLDGQRVTVRTNQTVAELKAMKLHYGHGTDPYCNITDAADRSLPVFGPIALGVAPALTPFARRLRVTQPLPGTGRLEGLTFPENLEALPWRAVEFPTDFCNLHEDLAPLAPQELLIYYRGRIAVPEPMKLAALLGYDGPVKLWVDGQELLHDPDGTNPAMTDRARGRFAAAPGTHEILVALGSNQCRAWGIFLRFERLDVPKSVLRKGPEHYRMPELLAD